MRTVEVHSLEDFPCSEFNNDNQCELKQKWHEGETRVCLSCRVKIKYVGKGKK